MAVTLALAGDTMLGRKVADRLADADQPALWSSDVADLVRSADACLLNLECCISDRGRRWADPTKPFFFRAPPAAAAALRDLGVGVVTLANNHALDYGPQALIDTLGHLDAAGIAWTGAGRDLDQARRPAVADLGDIRLAVVGLADHPAAFAAASNRPGIAYADLHHGVPDWVTQTIAAVDADVVVVTPHWGPNMVASPVGWVRAAAPVLRRAGAALVVGHSAHVFHGVETHPDGVVAYDLGDFLDDYAVNSELRNDLGVLWLVELDERGVTRIEAVPLTLEFCHTRLADGADARWVRERLRAACEAFGTDVGEADGRLVIDVVPHA